MTSWSEKREKSILKLSFFAGLLFALAELVFAVYSHSQSSLMDAVYDSSELVFVALTLFLTPLFHQPVSEKYPFGYLQVESIFLIIKGFMMLSVTASVLLEVVDSALSGGNPVNAVEISVFQFVLCIGSIVVFKVMKNKSRSLSSPTVNAEILGWKQDIAYSFGMAVAFFGSVFLKNTPFAFLAPYFDQLITVLIVLFMLPDNIKMLWNTMRDIFLFSPDRETVEEIKSVCNQVLEKSNFYPVFFDITRTGRHLWVAVYFEVKQSSCSIDELREMTQSVNRNLAKQFSDCTCELILVP